jgi:hypothetical protein
MANGRCQVSVEGLLLAVSCEVIVSGGFFFSCTRIDMEMGRSPSASNLDDVEMIAVLRASSQRVFEEDHLSFIPKRSKNNYYNPQNPPRAPTTSSKHAPNIQYPQSSHLPRNASLCSRARTTSTTE